MNRIYLTYFLGILILLISSCQDQKKHKQYLYVSKAVYNTINNKSYNKSGYPEDYSFDNGNYYDKSYILLDQKENKVTIYNSSGIESFDIVESWNDDMLYSDSYNFQANDNRNNTCLMSVSKVPIFGHVFIVMRPYQSGRLYQVEYVDPELLVEELKKRFNTIPRN